MVARNSAKPRETKPTFDLRPSPFRLSDEQRVVVREAMKAVMEEVLEQRLRRTDVEPNTIGVRSSNSPINVETACQPIRIVIEGDIDKFTSVDRDKVLRVIAAIIDREELPEPTRYEEGSILMTLDLTPVEAERLLWAIKAGDLVDVAVVDAELLEVPTEFCQNPDSIPMCGTTSAQGLLSTFDWDRIGAAEREGDVALAKVADYFVDDGHDTALTSCGTDRRSAQFAVVRPQIRRLPEIASRQFRKMSTPSVGLVVLFVAAFIFLLGVNIESWRVRHQSGGGLQHVAIVARPDETSTASKTGPESFPSDARTQGVDNSTSWGDSFLIASTMGAFNGDALVIEGVPNISVEKLYPGLIGTSTNAIGKYPSINAADGVLSSLHSNVTMPSGGASGNEVVIYLPPELEGLLLADTQRNVRSLQLIEPFDKEMQQTAFPTETASDLQYELPSLVLHDGSFATDTMILQSPQLVRSPTHQSVDEVSVRLDGATRELTLVQVPEPAGQILLFIGLLIVLAILMRPSS